MASMRPKSPRRRELQYALIAVGCFVYILCLTSQRLALKERYGQIKEVETALQAMRANEQKLKVTIEQHSDYTDILKQGDGVARPEQCKFLIVENNPADGPIGLTDGEQSNTGTIRDRIVRIFREGVAQARPANPREGGDDSPAR